jgi:putative chitinase
MTIDREKLFTSVRQSVFHGHFRQSQVDGINIILDTWDASVFDDLRWLAYMLGTSYHETGATMQPIKEWGDTAYFTRMYDVTGKRPDTARKMGNTRPGDGPKYCGRGFVQLTWKNNYERAGQLLGIDLVNNPDLAMVPANAARIMFEGMTDANIIFEDEASADSAFSFTGKTLEDYFNDSTEDWINARRIINGTDHAAMIAGTAQDFYVALEEV